MFDFSDVIRELKNGRKAKRQGWNGKDQYIFIGYNISYDTKDGSVNFAWHDDIGSKAIIFHGTRGEQVGWLASQSDMLADDWIILD